MINVFEMDFDRDLSNESFDKLASVGMFEHVGRSHLLEYIPKSIACSNPAGYFSIMEYRAAL